MGNVHTKNDAGWTMKNPRFRSAILSLVTLGVISAFVYYLDINADKFLNLLRVSPLPVIFILLLSLTTPFLNGLINTYMCRALDADLSIREGFLLAAVSTLANQLPVSGGIVTKGVYLKHKHGLAYTKFLSAMLAILFCTFAVYGLLGLGILLYWVLFKSAAIAPVLFIGFGGMAACLVIFWLPLERIRIPDFLLKWVRHALEGWLLISKNPLLILKLLTIQTSMMLVLALRYWLAFHMLSQNVTISQVILFSCATILTNLVSFAPGGFGVREAIVGGIATALGFDFGVSVIAVGLDRLISMVMIILIGWTSTIILGKQISETSVKTVEQEA
jgi:uncharacterized membrane protein YbhN (UPF0104 family)